MWELSQNGLLRDRPQRQSVARNATSWPAMVRSADGCAETVPEPLRLSEWSWTFPPERARLPSLVQAAMDDTRVALRIERRLRPKQPDNFGIVSSETFLDIYRGVTSGVFAILIGVVSLSLVVGGIVIMNIMLMTVSERTREIGLRKSLGARRRDILWQILTESITLSTFGGVIGTGLGFLVAWGISKVSPLPAIVEPWSVVLGISMTAIVGLFFGLYPAMRAASLDPIEALRRE